MKNHNYFEVRSKPEISNVKCVILDYDGTLTTLRKGWDKILGEFARDKINAPKNEQIPELDDKIRHLTDHAGGTTPKQIMARLMELIEYFQFIPPDKMNSLEEYALEYVDHFEDIINDRLSNFEQESEKYIIHGVRPMLDFLKETNTLNYIVTGSCTDAVSNELQKISLNHHFLKVYGATVNSEADLKEKAILEIMDRHSLEKHETLIVGDGSTEIRAAAKLDLPAIGIASNEHHGGICTRKRQTLLDLGAHVIIHDYENFPELWDWLHN